MNAEKKYRLVGEATKEGLRRIVALRDFNAVKKGELGGWIRGEHNLSHDGACWVFGNAKVFDNVWVRGNARVYGNARVFGTAHVYGNAEVLGDASVYDNARVFGNVWVQDNARVYGNARVFGDAHVYGNAEVLGDAHVLNNADVYDTAEVYGNATVKGNASISAPHQLICISGFAHHITVTPQNVVVGCNSKQIRFDVRLVS